MGWGFTDMTAEGKRYFAQLQQLAQLEIQVGFQSGENPYDDGADLAEVAAFNEYGDSNTPARPFMRQSFENHEDELHAACNDVNAKLANGVSARAALEPLGVFCKGLVQNEIKEGGFAPNSPATIKRKGSDQPLIDTGHMRQSVNYVIKKR